MRMFDTICHNCSEQRRAENLVPRAVASNTHDDLLLSNADTLCEPCIRARASPPKARAPSPPPLPAELSPSSGAADLFMGPSAGAADLSLEEEEIDIVSLDPLPAAAASSSSSSANSILDLSILSQLSMSLDRAIDESKVNANWNAFCSDS